MVHITTFTPFFINIPYYFHLMISYQSYPDIFRTNISKFETLLSAIAHAHLVDEK